MEVKRQKEAGLLTDDTENDRDRTQSSKFDGDTYDPTLRHLQYEFTEECQYEILSEFDTEEARLLRQMEEEVFDIECESEEYG